MLLRVSPQDWLASLELLLLIHVHVFSDFSLAFVRIVPLLLLLLVLDWFDHEMNLFLLVVILRLDWVHLHELLLLLLLLLDLLLWLLLGLARSLCSLRLDLLLHTVEEIELPLHSLFVDPWIVLHVVGLVLEVLLVYMLVGHLLAGHEVRRRWETLQSVFEHWEVMDTHKCIALHQLCLLLLVLRVHHILRVVLGVA